MPRSKVFVGSRLVAIVEHDTIFLKDYIKFEEIPNEPTVPVIELRIEPTFGRSIPKPR